MEITGKLVLKEGCVSNGAEATIEFPFDREKIIDMYLSAENGGTLYYMLIDYLQATHFPAKPEPEYCWDKTHYRGGSDKGIATCMDCGKLIGEFFKVQPPTDLPEPDCEPEQKCSCGKKRIYWHCHCCNSEYWLCPHCGLASKRLNPPPEIPLPDLPEIKEIEESIAFSALELILVNKINELIKTKQIDRERRTNGD